MSFRRFTPPDARSTRRGRSQLLGGTRRRTTLTIAALLATCYTLLTWPAAAAPLPGLHLEPRAAQLEERRYACIQGQCNVCRFGAGHLRGREALESEKSQQRVNGTFVSAAQLSAEGVRFLQVGGDWWNKCGDGWLNADMVFTRLPSGVVCEDWRTGRLIMRLVAGQGLPFADGSFDAVYSEHMFEHILPRDGNSTPLPRHFLVVARAMAAAPGPEPLLHFSFSQPVHPRSTSPRPLSYLAGAAFLAEAYRVLRPGGAPCPRCGTHWQGVSEQLQKRHTRHSATLNSRGLERSTGILRITTPDLDKYMRGYVNRETDPFLQEHARRLSTHGRAGERAVSTPRTARERPR